MDETDDNTVISVAPLYRKSDINMKQAAVAYCDSVDSNPDHHGALIPLSTSCQAVNEHPNAANLRQVTAGKKCGCVIKAHGSCKKSVPIQTRHGLILSP